MLERHRLNAMVDTESSTRARKIASELPQTSEGWTFTDQFKGLAIVGKSGGGKTTLAELFGIVYKIPRTRIFKIGEMIKMQEGKDNAVDYVDRPVDVDIEIDSIQANLISNAENDDPFILEGRLANVWLRNIEQTNPETGTHVKSILIDVPDEIAHTRLQNRAPELEIGQVAEITQIRADWDTNRWTQVHEAVRDKDPYDPEAFDFIADATKTIPEVFLEIHDWMIENGLVTRTSRAQDSNDLQTLDSANISI